MNSLDILNILATKPRSGWLKRGVPETLVEVILEHSLNVKRACIYALEGGIIEVPLPFRFIDLGYYHDFIEGIAPDITPFCGYSKEEQEKIELEAADRIRVVLGQEGEYIYSLLIEYITMSSIEAQTLYVLDKVDAGVKALAYEKLGYNVQDFYEYCLEKIKGNPLENIYKELLKKEFKDIDPHFQYFTLLKLGGDIIAFRTQMKKIIESEK